MTVVEVLRKARDHYLSGARPSAAIDAVVDDMNTRLRAKLELARGVVERNKAGMPREMSIAFDIAIERATNTEQPQPER